MIQSEDNQDALIVYWPSDLDEINFVSPTSFITEASLSRILKDKGLIDASKVDQQEKINQEKREKALLMES